MFQSHVYLEVRILIAKGKPAFLKKDKPSLDKSAAEKVRELANSLGCTIPKSSRFEKLTGSFSVPSEYNFSGLSLKAGEDGCVQIEFHRRKKNIRIEELRVEEDAGRLTHSNGVTRMDYTWAGCASVRLRTSDDFELGEEAVLFLDELRRRIQYMKIADGVSIDSLIRCNAYVSLAKYPETPSYYVKLRNLNSFNFVRKAINAELDRQESILSSGGLVSSESRLWNERQNRTESYQNRSIDVRHFETVKPVIEYSFEESEKTDRNFLELPEERRLRFCKLYGLSRIRAEFICDDKDRADFFEKVVSLGADPMMSAHWFSSELMKHLRRAGLDIEASPLTPERFARIMYLLSSKQIHSTIAKQLMQAVVEEACDPDEILEKNNWKQIIDENVLLPVIKQVIEVNTLEAEKIRKGEMAPLEFLTGLVMRRTDGLASPLVVKQLLKKELNVNIVYILSMGGSICGRREKGGDVSASDERVLKSLLSDIDPSIRYQVISLGKLLSEEIEPADWASLIAEISNRIAGGTANGIVVAHGTDTLSFTAPLLYWLFADCDVPVVVTASSTTPDESDEAEKNLLLAVNTACQKKNGVYVVYGEKILSPINLKFERPSPDGFSNWNMKEPVFTCGSGPLSGQMNGLSDSDPIVMRQILREAANQMIVCRVYPGLRAEYYVSLIEKGISYIFLELYETGTASMRTGDYSLKPLLIKGKKKGCKFYCTSQQQSLLDFSGYTTSRRVWREGAVPMGSLTTESAVALYFAASLVSDSSEELNQCMEAYSELFTSTES